MIPTFSITKAGLEEQWQYDTCAMLFEVARRAPGQDLKLEIDDARLHLLQSPKRVSAVLRNQSGAYNKYFGEFSKYFGNSRLTTDGELWRKLRDYSQPYLTSARAQDIADTTRRYFKSATEDMLNECLEEGQIITDRHVDFAATCTVSELSLGMPVDDWGSDFIGDVHTVLKSASSTNFLTRDRGFTIEHAMLEEDAREAKDRLAALISNAASEQKSGQGLLSALVNANDPDLDTFAEVSTLLFAGFDTTATGLSWAMLLLAVRPEIQEMLRRKILASDYIKASGNVEDLLALTELQAFVHEALRIFPPIPLLSRITSKNDNLEGELIGENQRVMLSIVGLHYAPDIYPDPFEVKIDRFPEGKIPRTMAANYLPFGDGKRVCPGMRFANVEMLAALASILSQAKIEAPGAGKIEFEWEASMRRRGGQSLALSAL